MHIIHECFTTDSDILELNILDNTQIALYTKNHGIKFASAKMCKIELFNKKINSEVTCISFSPDAKYIVFYLKHNIYVLHIHSNLITRVIPTNAEEVEILSFDPSSRYIIAGTLNGRVLQYSTNGATLLARLCSFPYERPLGLYNITRNFVSAFAFHQNQIACSGYDGAIIILDLITLSNKKVISHSRTTTDALCFVDEKTLVSGNRDGVIYISSLVDTKEYKQLNAPFMNIKQIIVLSDPNYIMIHSELNYIAIIDIKNLKILHDKYLIFEHNIKKILLTNDNFLIVALKNTKVFQVKLSTLQDLQNLIQSNSFESAYKLILDEPMLKNTQEHKTLELKYEKIYTQAINALIKQNKKYALQLMDIFKNIASKQNDTQSLFRAFDNYAKFKELFVNKKHTLLYAMANKFPQLQKTPEYKKMEIIFKQHFAKAQRAIILGNKENAKTILREYITISSKRALIQLIIHNNESFIDFLKAIDERNFQKAHKLALKNDIYTQIPSFHALNIEITNKLTRIKEHIKFGEITSATLLLTKLKNIASINNIVSELLNQCSAMLRLQQAYTVNDFKSCYEILDAHGYLKTTELGTLLEKHFIKLINSCEKFALNGDIKSIKSSLDTLVKIHSRKERIGNIFRVSFLSKIESLIQNKKFDNAQSIIYRYIDIFGIESEIYALMKKFEILTSKKLAITQSQHLRFSRDYWMESKIINS